MTDALTRLADAVDDALDDLRKGITHGDDDE